MALVKRARLYLDDPTRRRLADGRHNFLGHVAGALKDHGWNVGVHPDSTAAMLPSRTRRGFAMFHMTAPTTGQGVSFRRAYVFPFWRIEATEKRWEFDVAQQAFDATSIESGMATEFVNRTRRRVFDWMKTGSVTGESIYVPLQGRLLTRRSFQRCSPIEMVAKTLAAFPDDPVCITTHPGETYTGEETFALRELVARHRNATISTATPQQLLPRAKLVVTQNSSVAFIGFFHHRPAVLFAKSDFHHIAAQDFDAALAKPPDFDRYLFWFLQVSALNAGRDDIRDRIAARLRALGWPI